MNSFPRVTFGMIVLNGEPFTRYNLRALYPFAHEIIVVEGAAPGAAAIATSGGHSTDGTLEVLHRFKAEEDPEGKLQIVTRDGFWAEKDEMSQAYAGRATGDYLWQVDVDEFYLPEAMQATLNMLRDDPEITAVSFPTLTFWGGLDYITDGWYLRRGDGVYHRLFMWGAGYCYMTHRPPTVVTPDGRDTRQIKWVHGADMARRGVVMYHYSLLFPHQVMEKCQYYEQAAWAQRAGAQNWAEESFMRLRRPFRVHNVFAYPSWLERFAGDHPPQVKAMWEDIANGKVAVARRQTDDIERLLASPGYGFQRAALKRLDYADRMAKLARRAIRKGRRLARSAAAKLRR